MIPEQIEKTVVRIEWYSYQCIFKSGDIGYIDGYIRGADERPYAVVVSGENIDMVPLINLKVITPKQ